MKFKHLWKNYGVVFSTCLSGESIVVDGMAIAGWYSSAVQTARVLIYFACDQWTVLSGVVAVWHWPSAADR